MFRINKSIETEGKLVVARDWRQAEWNVTTNEYRFLIGLIKIFLN